MLTLQIRYNFNKSDADILDLTDVKVAAEWGYVGGDDYAVPQAIARQAQTAGFNVIRFSSLRGAGANLAVMNDFDKLLQPQMIVPVPQELKNSIYDNKLTRNIRKTCL